MIRPLKTTTVALVACSILVAGCGPKDDAPNPNVTSDPKAAEGMRKPQGAMGGPSGPTTSKPATE